MPDKIYVFDRYRNGRLMAEGAKITKATSEQDALSRAHELFESDREVGDLFEFKLREVIDND